MAKDVKKYKKKYRQEHVEQIKEYSKQYYKKHKEQIKEQTKKYAENNKEYCKLKSARHKAKQHGYGFNQILPNVYSDTDIEISWHHINDNDVVALPYVLHDRYMKNHREILNVYVEILYGVNLKEIIT